ncbi:MAG: YbjN domain-containing protein [Firmicutes bacterium]|nr:YbjN domain-containing protein [Bacillota bacterium]
MSENEKFDPMVRMKELVEQFCAEKSVDLSTFEDGFILDIPVEYLTYVSGCIDEDMDCATRAIQGVPPVVEKCLDKKAETFVEQRRQFVYITANRKGLDEEDIIQVFTICAPEEERFYKSALLLNMNLPFGAFAVSQVEGQNYFVMVDTYLASSVTYEELALSIMCLAKSGDKMEKMLMGEDNL